MTDTLKNQREAPLPKKRGRPKLKQFAEPPKAKKIKLKPRPKDAKQAYLKRYADLGVLAVYGLDEFTDELIQEAWKNPNIEIFLCDSREALLDNYNRKMSQRSFSMFRWNAVRTSGFFETPVSPVVVVAKDYIDEAKKRPNPYNTLYVLLEDFA